MNQQKMSGDYVVTGLVTGTHIIEDIGVPVPHQIAVRIPADLAHRSRDLWIGIQQKRLFLLKGGSGLSVVVPNGMATAAAKVPNQAKPSPDASKEIQQLRGDLSDARRESADLRASLKAQEGKLEAILTAVGQLSQVSAASVQAAVKAVGGAVGGEAPMFIPDGLKSESVGTNIKVTESTVTGVSVASAASKLRDLKKGRGKKSG